MNDKSTVAAEHTAVRVALWRALHLEVESPPYVLKDDVGLQLANPEAGWRARPDMDPQRTSLFRASIVARARFIEDLVEEEQTHRGVSQYVILGAGLDSFAQRRPELASRLHVFEVDAPGPQAWKRQRLAELGYGIPHWLRFVPVDFETSGGVWREKLIAAGFETKRPAVVVSTGVSMYLTRDAIMATLGQMSVLAPGSVFAMTYILPIDHSMAEERPGREMSEKGARNAGTPFISFFTGKEMTAMAREAGFKDAKHVTASTLTERYFQGRVDGFHLGGSEEFLIATT